VPTNVSHFRDGRVETAGVALLILVVATIAILLAQTLGRAALAVALGPIGVGVGAVVVQSLLLVGVAVGAARVLRADGGRLLRWRAPTRRDWLVLCGALALMGVLVGALYGLDALGLPIGQNQVDTVARQYPVASLAFVPVAVLFVGPGEELVFRGAIQGVLKRAVSTRAAICWAAVLFGGLHALAVTGSTGGVLVYLGFAALLGGVLGWSYETTGNLLVPVLAHGLYDAGQFLLQYLALAGHP